MHGGALNIVFGRLKRRGVKPPVQTSSFFLILLFPTPVRVFTYLVTHATYLAIVTGRKRPPAASTSALCKKAGMVLGSHVKHSFYVLEKEASVKFVGFDLVYNKC